MSVSTGSVSSDVLPTSTSNSEGLSASDKATSALEGLYSFCTSNGAGVESIDCSVGKLDGGCVGRCDGGAVLGLAIMLSIMLSGEELGLSVGLLVVTVAFVGVLVGLEVVLRGT